MAEDQKTYIDIGGTQKAFVLKADKTLTHIFEIDNSNMPETIKLGGLEAHATMKLNEAQFDKWSRFFESFTKLNYEIIEQGYPITANGEIVILSNDAVFLQIQIETNSCRILNHALRDKTPVVIISCEDTKPYTTIGFSRFIGYKIFSAEISENLLRISLIRKE